MTLLAGSAVYHGHCHPLKQTFAGDSECINPSKLQRSPYSDEMTRHDDAVHGFEGQQTLDFSTWTLGLAFGGQSFASTDNFEVPASDATKSPGRGSHQQSSGPSEDTGSPNSHIVLTPSSSLEYAFVNGTSDRAFEDEDDASRSPLSDSIFSSTTDSSFCFVNHPTHGENIPTDRPLSRMDPRPQPATSRGSTRPSRASSVAKSSTSSHHRPSATWDATVSAAGSVMNPGNHDLPTSSFDDDLGFTFDANSFQAQDQPLMSDLVIPDSQSTHDHRNVTQNSFRAFDDGAQQAFGNYTYAPGMTFNQPAPAQAQYQRSQYLGNQYQQSQQAFRGQTLLSQPSFNVADYTTGPDGTQGVVPQQPMSSNGAASCVPSTNGMPIRPQQRIVVHQQQQPGSARTAPYPRPYNHNPILGSTWQQSSQPRAVNAVAGASVAPSRRATLAPREDPRPHVLPSNAPTASSQTGLGPKKGGRARNMRLTDEKRRATSIMRGVTACWRCALQRDKCDDGETCRRCMMRSQKGQRDMFGCDRSKLPEWIYDLLPDSMTDMHSRPSIEKYVTNQVARWNTSNCIDIYLTSGYGPPLIWRCCEFQPKNQELLGQLQYLHEPGKHAEQRTMKYSPPFALEKLDESDDARFQEYLDSQLMHPEILETLGWAFYQGECIVDPECFQTQVLELICTLSSETRDSQLREALQDIIRMLIVTYIMGHTLTIVEETLPTVLSSVRFTPLQSRAEEFTSPRLANRQLKHYFSSLRHKTFNKVLHRQQQTFHASNKKEAHWLVSFCAMLGLAMVLEETQITIWIQADAKIVKNEMTKETADAEAFRNCQRIDEKFERLVFYFQKKYRDRKWGDDGSFGRGTPRYGTLPESSFLGALYTLLVQRQTHLRSRDRASPGPRHECNYTTRLVAKFLLPFLALAT